jgi:hypothetical protein
MTYGCFYQPVHNWQSKESESRKCLELTHCTDPAYPGHYDKGKVLTCTFPSIVIA